MITLSMIVKNEEALLPICLKSVKDFVDEIIIVDTGSSDATMDIARSFGATVEPFGWVDDFSAARNYALSKVKTPWILWLDADDIVLNPEILPAITQQAHKDRCTGIWSIYKQDESCYQRRLQLFKTKDYQWEGVVHESPQPKPGRNTDTVLSKLTVLHCKPLERCPQAARQYLDILLKKDSENWLGLAESYKFLACYPDSPAKVEEYLKLADENYFKAFEWPQTNDQTKYICLFHMSRIHLDLTRWNPIHLTLAKRYAQYGIAVAPTRAECWTVLGQANEMEGDIPTAAQCYTKALQLEPPLDDIGLVYQDYYTIIPQKLLTAIKELVEAERIEQAIDESLMGERKIYIP